MHKKCALFTIRFLTVSTRGFKYPFARDLRPQPVHRLSRCLRKSERDEPKPGNLNATALTTNYRTIERSNKYGASRDNTTNDVLSFIYLQWDSIHQRGNCHTGGRWGTWHIFYTIEPAHFHLFTVWIRVEFTRSQTDLAQAIPLLARLAPKSHQLPHRLPTEHIPFAAHILYRRQICSFRQEHLGMTTSTVRRRHVQAVYRAYLRTSTFVPNIANAQGANNFLNCDSFFFSVAALRISEDAEDEHAGH